MVILNQFEKMKFFNLAAVGLPLVCSQWMGHGETSSAARGPQPSSGESASAHKWQIDSNGDKMLGTMFPWFSAYYTGYSGDDYLIYQYITGGATALTHSGKQLNKCSYKF